MTKENDASESKIDIRRVLKVFDIITSEGEKTSKGFFLNGLYANTGFDGYTVFISNDYVTLSVFFHNKFSLEFSSKKEKNIFLVKIDEIYNSKKRA